MAEKKKIVSVAIRHIEAGIQRYEGKLDIQLNALLHNAGFNYSSYTFKDGRILLVLPDNIGAFLYADLETVLQSLQLET